MSPFHRRILALATFALLVASFLFGDSERARAQSSREGGNSVNGEDVRFSSPPTSRPTSRSNSQIVSQPLGRAAYPAAVRFTDTSEFSSSDSNAGEFPGSNRPTFPRSPRDASEIRPVSATTSSSPTAEPNRLPIATEQTSALAVPPHTKTARKITPPKQGREAGAERGKSSSPLANRGGWGTMISLLLVLGLFLFCARVARKKGVFGRGGIPAEALEHLGKRQLDARQSIQFLRLGSRILVVGTTAGNMQTLAVLDDPVEVDYLAGLCRRKSDEPTQPERTFSSLLRRARGQGEGESSPVGRAADLKTSLPTTDATAQPRERRLDETMPFGSRPLAAIRGEVTS